MKALESTIESYLVKRVEALGGICLKADVPGRRFLDRICVMPDGVTGYAELKRGKDADRRALQVYYIDKLQEMGHVAAFIDSKAGVDRFMTALSDMCRIDQDGVDGG